MQSYKKCVFSVTLLLTVLYIIFHDTDVPFSVDQLDFRRPHILNESDHQGPANSHLGFDAVVAVSAPGSPRRPKLIQAANITEIDLTIPELPHWTPHDVGNFTEKLEYGGRETGRGSALAWLSHTHILEWFLKTNLQSVLILEDDVDWDIRLRTVQIPRAAAAARSIFQPATTYWGNPAAWDVLWLGHCGDWFDKLEKGLGADVKGPSNLTSRPHVVYQDPSLPTRDDLHPFSKKFLDSLQLPDQARALHKSGYPLCTFGYAVTRASARRILRDIAPTKRPESCAFDAAMLLGCRKRGLKCFTLNPEIFHHMRGDSLITVQEGKKKEEVFLPPVDAEGLKQSEARNETSNIACGFASGDFAFEDQARLEYLREEVGRKGRCMKPGRDWTGTEGWRADRDKAWRESIDAAAKAREMAGLPGTPPLAAI